MTTRIEPNVNIEVHHLTRVEGHGNIVVDVESGIMTRCELQIVETPRFFEAMLRGRPYQQASHLTSRICGICAVGHATASLRATETALGITLSHQTQLLRRLNFYGEILDSHILHAYMLIAPDFFGVDSVIPLANLAPHVVKRALRLKALAGEICRVIAGRHTHPIAMTAGGFTHFPKEAELLHLRERLRSAREDVAATVELFQGLNFPAFKRETEYIALQQPDHYAWIDGTIASTDGGSWPLDAYREVTNEYLVEHSTAKRCANTRKSYMVGALARFNINYDQLLPQAKAAAAALGMQPLMTNPYLITAAQVVEVVHAVEDSILLIDDLLDQGIRPEAPAAPTRRSGRGVGAAEVPRGLLFHEYSIEDGLITQANCIIPTGQNLQNIEDDMRDLVPQIVDRTQEEITLALEMLVRAYDPCISCSTHMLDVRFE